MWLLGAANMMAKVIHRFATAIAAAALVAVGTAVPAAGATAITVSGTRIGHTPPGPVQLLPEYFAGDTVIDIDYPATILGMDRSIATAAAGVARAVDDTDGPLVVAGFSQGAIAVAYEKRLLMDRPPGQRPQADRLTFVTVGDPTGAGGIMRFLPFPIPVLGLSPIAVPETPYDGIVVTGEYDGWADFPDRPWNLISLANALLGVIYVHGRYELLPDGLDLAAVPEQNITTVTNSLGGRTTTYVIPTARLPLIQPLRDIGVPEPVVAALEVPLRRIVDAGYVRNDPAKAVAPPGASPTAAAQRLGRSPARAAASPRRIAAEPAAEASAGRGAARTPARGATARRVASVM